MTLVSACKNFTATVNNAIERSIKENGDRTDNFAQVVNSNLPESFTLSIPVFKGGNKENLEVETFAKIDGRNVAFVLMSPGAEKRLKHCATPRLTRNLKQSRRLPRKSQSSKSNNKAAPPPFHPGWVAGKPLKRIQHERFILFPA